MKTRKDRVEQNLKDLERLFEGETWPYRFGYLLGWMASLAADDITVRQQLERRLEAKLNARNQKDNGADRSGPRARS